MFFNAPQVYCCDIVEVVKSLFGNLIFDGQMHFCTERIFDESRKHIFNEIWTSDWWWEIQSKLPNWATVILIMLNSDATLLNKLGHQKVHPIYITIGKIQRRYIEDQASMQ